MRKPATVVLEVSGCILLLNVEGKFISKEDIFPGWVSGLIAEVVEGSV